MLRAERDRCGAVRCGAKSCLCVILMAVLRAIATATGLSAVAATFGACATDEPYRNTGAEGLVGVPPVEAGQADAAAGDVPPQPQGTCDPRFCRDQGFGMPCCVEANGPCGIDMGMGCVPLSGPPDAG